MNRSEFIIIDCPKCGIKNKVKSYDSDMIPVCGKCRFELIDRDQNEVHSRYGKMEDAFHHLPEIGLRNQK